MPETEITAVLDAAQEVDSAEDAASHAARVVDFLAKVHDYSADLIRLLARVGPDDGRAHLSEEQADMSAVTAEGYREFDAGLRKQSGEVEDPDA